MKLFVIEAYGGPLRANGSIARFTVCARNSAEAIDIVHASSLGQQYGRFELVEETGEFEADEPGIISHNEEFHGERI